MVSGDVLKLECGALVVGIPAGGLTPTAEALDKASEGAVSRWIEAGDIHPCVGKVAVSVTSPDVRPNGLCSSA